MPNMCSATDDFSEYQTSYIEVHNVVKCFFKFLSAINRGMKQLAIF